MSGPETWQMLGAVVAAIAVLVGIGAAIYAPASQRAKIAREQVQAMTENTLGLKRLSEDIQRMEKSRERDQDKLWRYAANQDKRLDKCEERLHDMDGRFTKKHAPAETFRYMGGTAND